MTETVEFSPDGNLLVSSGAHDIKLWDARTWNLHKVIDESANRYAVTFSPDGSLLGYLEDYEPLAQAQTLRVLDLHTQQLRDSRLIEGRQIHSLAFAPDSRYYAIANTDHSIKIWDITGEEQPKTLSGHRANVERILFSPDERTLASVSVDHALKIWDVATNELRHDLVGESGTFVFSSKGRTLIVVRDGTIFVWDVTTGLMVDTFAENIGGVHDIALSSDKTTLAIAVDRSVSLWDLIRRDERVQFRCKSPVLSVAFSPDGRTLVAGLNDGTIRIWQAADPEEVRQAGW